MPGFSYDLPPLGAHDPDDSEPDPPAPVVHGRDVDAVGVRPAGPPVPGPGREERV